MTILEFVCTRKTTLIWLGFNLIFIAINWNRFWLVTIKSDVKAEILAQPSRLNWLPGRCFFLLSAAAAAICVYRLFIQHEENHIFLSCLLILNTCDNDRNWGKWGINTRMNNVSLYSEYLNTWRLDLIESSLYSCVPNSCAV